MAVALFSKDVEVHASAAMVVLDTYPRMMVEIIANQWPPKQVLKLTRNDQSFMQKITPLEAKMISKLDVTGYNDLDVSCIYKLIRHFKLLPVPNQGWGNKPLKADTKEEDDVERIRRYRNDILHRPRGGLSEQDGQDFFQDSYDMAKRLDISIGSPMNGFESQIKALQCSRVDKQTYVKALEKCAEYKAQLQETRDTPNVDLYYGNDIILKIGSKDSQAASADSRCAIYIRDQSLDVNAIIQNIEDIKKTLEMGHYNVIKLDGAESGSLILHISIPNACFVTEDTLHDSLRSFLHHFFLIAGIHSKTGHSFTIVLAESERYITDADEQDLEYLSETPLPILKLDVNVHHSAFQNENVLYKEVNEFITKMYDAIDSNGVPVNGSQREVMMITGSENDTKKQLKESDTDAQLQETRDTQKVELYYEKDTLLKLSNKDNQEASDDCGAAGETKPEGYSVDDHWRKLVMEIYYNHIISTVTASEISINLSSVLTIDEKRSIRQRERNKNSEEAMKLLLDKFDEKDCPGKWIEFRSALVEADYEWIVKAIEGDVNCTELTTWQNMMISSKIIPRFLLHDLCNEKIISQQSSEEIRKEEQDKGDISAAFLLLASIPRMHSQWYPKFMEILFLNGWDELVADVDADEWKRLNHKHKHKMSDHAKYYADQSLCINREKENMKKILPSKFQQSYTKENYESYTEKPIIYPFNMSSNHRLEQCDRHYLHRSLYHTSDEITRENQLARTSQIQLPVPSRRGQIGQTFPSVPETSVYEPQPTDEEYVSIMLQDVKRNLEMEVNDEPEQNISRNVETTKTTTHSLETMKVLSEVAKSVGHIIGPKESGTCWRVGYDKIITAAHVVVDNIWNPMIGYLYEKDLDNFRVDFECIRKESSSYDQFKVVPSVLFMDQSLDVAVLQLKPNEKKPFPPPLKMFHVLNPEKDQDKQIYLISHNQSKKKGVNSGIGIWKPTENKLQYLERVSQQYGDENVYIGLDRKDRLVIQCDFVGGSSGSPGIVILNSVAYVVLVYIRGFPSFYHSKQFSKVERRKFPTDNLFQQGVNIGNLFAAMSNEVDNIRLRDEIFPEEALKLEQIKFQQQLAITGDKTSHNTETTDTSIEIVKSMMDNVSAKTEMKISISKGTACTDQIKDKIPDASRYDRLMLDNSVRDQTYITSPEEDSERYKKAGNQSAQSIKTGGSDKCTVRDQGCHSHLSTDNVAAGNLLTKDGDIITIQRNFGNTIPVYADQISIEIQKIYGHNPSDVQLRSSIPELTGVESKETEANANESDVKQNYVSVSENYRKSTNNLSCPKEKHEDSMDELQDSIMSSLMSFDENNLRSRDETSEKNVFSTESAKPQVVDKDMSLSSDPLEREPNSLLFERINRDLAIAVSETPEEIQHNILQMPYDDVESVSDSEDETIPQKVLNLREYQKELAEPAKGGKNCLIVAPTGCGKTHVIMDIIQDHNSKMSRKGLIVKVAVLVEQQALAEQQAERCKEYLQPLRVKLITGEIHRVEKLPKLLSSWLKRRDILVITSALLDNYLKSGDIKIEDFTLLVFDECHHAKDKHSYARVMHYYMDRKFDDNFPRERLPKVIGLTASVGVGKSNKIPGAKIHIKTTMANLDAEELVTVKKNRLELSEHVVVPEKGVIVAPARQEDHYGKTLVKLMESTEKHIFTTPYAKMFEGNDSILKAPTEKGSDAYTQWISRLRRETAQINEEARRYITTWRSYLNVYNEALIIYEDARVKDATNYLEDKMYGLNEGIIKNKIDDTMKHLYDITTPMFVKCIDDKSYENPKLKELKTVIFKMLREKRDSRIIVFVKTRDLADAMVNWMKETNGLDRLKPHKFVGAQAAGAKGGMTKKDQTEILKLFKDGNRQIVCATSVAEEGLDIPTCNLVIRYDHVTNETAMIQSRGRGRAEGCQFIIIASEKRKTAEKEEINEIREEIMKEAIEDIQSDIKDNKEEFVEELEEIQRLAKKKRDKDALSEKGSSDNKELELRCEKCNHYICMSTDIKKIQDAHHAVVNDEIRKNVTVIKCNTKRIDHQISVNAGKVKCINCGSGLGQIIKFSEAQFPVLKIEHFYVTDTTGKNSYYKKWKSVPFKPTALSDDDLESRLQGPQYVDI